jgi:hypothetical protein
LQVLAVAIGSRPKIKVQINMYKVKHVLRCHPQIVNVT